MVGLMLIGLVVGPAAAQEAAGEQKKKRNWKNATDLGLALTAGNAEALASALHSMATRPEHARTMGDAGAQHVLGAFTWSRVIEAYELAYDEALGLATFAPEPVGAR